MTVITPVCAKCSRYHYTDIEHECCDAFPEGIPKVVLEDGHDHLTPIEGDHGLLFNPLPGFEWMTEGEKELSYEEDV